MKIQTANEPKAPKGGRIRSSKSRSKKNEKHWEYGYFELQFKERGLVYESQPSLMEEHDVDTQLRPLDGPMSVKLCLFQQIHVAI